MSRRKPMVYVRHMRDHAREAVEMARGRSRGDLDADRMLNLSLVRLMEVIGEASRRVPNEFRSGYPRVPWRDISDLRNQLIHAYDTVDFDTLWRIIQDELPPLIEQLESIIAEKE
jgi:uncharacterized protein with HEPN domain